MLKRGDLTGFLGRESLGKGILFIWEIHLAMLVIIALFCFAFQHLHQHYKGSCSCWGADQTRCLPGRKIRRDADNRFRRRIHKSEACTNLKSKTMSFGNRKWVTLDYRRSSDQCEIQRQDNWNCEEIGSPWPSWQPSCPPGCTRQHFRASRSTGCRGRRSDRPSTPCECSPTIRRRSSSTRSTSYTSPDRGGSQGCFRISGDHHLRHHHHCRRYRLSSTWTWTVLSMEPGLWYPVLAGKLDLTQVNPIIKSRQPEVNCEHVPGNKVDRISVMIGLTPSPQNPLKSSVSIDQTMAPAKPLEIAYSVLIRALVLSS